MKIKCAKCGHIEEVNKELIASVIGGSVSAFGFWAWTSYLFAGTGMALAICSAIIIGGPALYAYSNEIIQWLIQKGYKCKNCNSQNWIILKETDKNTNLTKQNQANNENEKIEPNKCSLINEIKKYENVINNSNSTDKRQLVLLAGSMLNDLNLNLVKKLCNKYKIQNSSQAKRIESLKNYLSKDIITDLYFLNSLRNKITHPDDWEIDLNNDDAQNSILSDCISAVQKMNYICKKTLL